MRQIREGLLHALDEQDIAVVCGDTGCGKTTQVPQYLLEHAIRCAAWYVADGTMSNQGLVHLRACQANHDLCTVWQGVLE